MAKCGCGRNVVEGQLGDCIGLHNLSENEYKSVLFENNESVTMWIKNRTENESFEEFKIKQNKQIEETEVKTV